MAYNEEGWISMHRQIQSHWIWQDANKLKWWLDILLTVNHKPHYFNIGNQLFTCQRGESLISLQGWAERWKVSKDKARNFLKLLEKDGMIKCVSVGKSTRLTVCKYDDYQPSLHVNQTQTKRKPNANQTQSHPNNNDNNENNEKKIESAQASDTFKTIDHLTITNEEYNTILGLGYTAGQVEDVFEKIGNYAANKKYKSLFSTAKAWLKTEYPEVVKKPEAIVKPIQPEVLENRLPDSIWDRKF